MTPQRSVFPILAGAAAAVLLCACAGGPTVESDLHIKGAPDWVNEGTGMFKTHGNRMFHGVGSAPPMGDLALQTETADNRARAELARILSSYMEVVLQDYSAAEGGAGAAQTSVSRQIESMTRVNLTGSRIIGRWRDTRSDTVYALAELDMDQVKDTLQRVQEMNAGLRAHVSGNGDNIFDRMTEKEER